jgi:hypothetical protein
LADSGFLVPWAMDKVAKAAAWGRRLHDPGASAANVLERLTAIEGKLTITVERAPLETTPSPTIDLKTGV